MGELSFSDNYSDLSMENGARAGFQFEFYCERCHDAFRSEFVPFRVGQAAELIGRASGFLGGFLGNASGVVDGIGEHTYGVERDKEFQKAIAQAEQHFHRCPRCANYFCDQCWNDQAGLCLGCAPSAEVEIEAAYASGKVYAVGESAALAGIRDGKKMDVKDRKQLVCPKCGAANEGARFCPECGEALAQKTYCAECGGEMPANAKFCTECGTKRAG